MKSPLTPLVSILIPCYNAEQWIAQAIESALAQTWANKEVIVVDDGSTDRSLNVIHGFGDRIRWESGPNRGGGAARNRLLELAKGEWLQYLDADDILLPEKIERQIQFKNANPDCDVIYSPVAWERRIGGRIVRTETPVPEPRDPWILLALWHLPQTGGALWKKAAIDNVGGWRIDQPCCQEHELYGRLLEANKRFEYCPGCFAVYRDHQHDERITRKSNSEFAYQRLAIVDRIEKHLEQHAILTPLRRQAINDARHDLARGLWIRNREHAITIHQEILVSDPSFRPTVTPSSPPLYTFVYNAFGFRTAQFIARCKRSLTRSSVDDHQ